MTLTEPQDHRTEQRQRILDAAATCFSREGFHDTSMQQICTEAGMSPGALYRYFPSKEAIIGAIVEAERAERTRLFDALRQSESLMAGLTAAMAELLTGTQSMCDRLGAEIFAEGSRNPKLRELLDPMERESHQMLRDLLAEAQRRGEIAADVDLEALQVLLLAIGDGLMLNHQRWPHFDIPGRLAALSGLMGRMISPRGTDVP